MLVIQIRFMPLCLLQRETLKQVSELQWCSKGRVAEKIWSDESGKGVTEMI